MSLQIAQAAVDDATIHFDKLYSYCIPPRLNDKVWPGSMVLVPFGRGNKPRMAVVLSVAALPEDADTQKLKTLYDAAPAEARLTPDLLELVRFLKDRTFCTWFEAVKAVIPYGAQYRAAVENGRPVMQNRLSRSTERLYTLAGELPAKPKPGPRQLAAMEALSTGPRQPASWMRWASPRQRWTPFAKRACSRWPSRISRWIFSRTFRSTRSR